MKLLRLWGVSANSFLTALFSLFDAFLFNT